MNEFVSPLAVTHASAFDAVAFGMPDLPPALLVVRDRMHTCLLHVLDTLPAPMQREACGIIDAYCGQPGAFFGLYYQPVWSFLHWVLPHTNPSLPAAAVDAAHTVQALGLFLHLWDDHLCDGQLPTTQLTLQVRSDAWALYVATARRLALELHCDAAWVDQHTHTYLGAIHLPQSIDNLADFCTRFEQQIAIWTLVPRLLGPLLPNTRHPDDLVHLVEAFSNAWRLMDDIQDVEDDVLAGVESAVWQVLDAQGRGAWAYCHACSQAQAQGQLDTASWAQLLTHLHTHGSIASLLDTTRNWLATAATLATHNQWHELAREIRQHLPPQTPEVPP